MFKQLFGQRPTTRADVVMAITGAAMAVWKAFDVYTEYKAEQADDNKEIQK